MEERDILELITVPLGILSIIGCLLIIIGYVTLDERYLGRKLIMFLSLADLGQGFVVLFHPFIAHPAMCRLQCYLGQGSVVASFLWTTCIAIYVNRIVTKPGTKIKKFVKFFHILCWGYPLMYILALVVESRRRPAPHPHCTIPLLTEHVSSQPPLSVAHGSTKKENNVVSAADVHIEEDPIVPWCGVPNTAENFGWRFGAIYFPLFICWILTACFYLHTQMHLSKMDPEDETPAMRKKRKKPEVKPQLMLIPLIFLCIRCFDVALRIVQLSSDISTSRIFPLSVLACLGVPSQGWTNALLYLIHSPKVRKKYISQIRKLLTCCCAGANEDRPLGFGESTRNTLKINSITTSYDSSLLPHQQKLNLITDMDDDNHDNQDEDDDIEDD